MTNCVMVYCIYPTPEDAERITRLLLEARLVACGNILPVGQSFYWWDDKIQLAQENVVIYKTTKDRFAAMKDAVIKAHPYDTPCVVALPIEDGHAPFLEWIGKEMK